MTLIYTTSSLFKNPVEYAYNATGIKIECCLQNLKNKNKFDWFSQCRCRSNRSEAISAVSKL